MGISNWGLDKRDAISAVKELTRMSIPLLGGDVLRWDKERWVHTYDNWHCNSLSGESRDAFAARSGQTSIQYIENYVQADKSKYLFVVVPYKGDLTAFE
jgi:Immunity protein 40